MGSKNQNEVLGDLQVHTDVSRYCDHPEASSASAVELYLQRGEGGLSQRDVTSPFAVTQERGDCMWDKETVYGRSTRSLRFFRARI